MEEAKKVRTLSLLSLLDSLRSASTTASRSINKIDHGDDHDYEEDAEDDDGMMGTAAMPVCAMFFKLQIPKLTLNPEPLNP